VAVYKFSHQTIIQTTITTFGFYLTGRFFCRSFQVRPDPTKVSQKTSVDCWWNFYGPEALPVIQSTAWKHSVFDAGKKISPVSYMININLNTTCKLPVTATFWDELLELCQCHIVSFNCRPIRDCFIAEIETYNDDVLWRSPLISCTRCIFFLVVASTCPKTPIKNQRKMHYRTV